MIRARLLLPAVLLGAGASFWLLRSCARPPEPTSVPTRVAPTEAIGPLLEGRGADPVEHPGAVGAFAESGASPEAAAAPRVPGGAEEAATVEGTVTGWDGKPAVGMSVFLVRGRDPVEGSPSTKTDEAGRYVLRRLPLEWAGVLVAQVSDTYQVRSAPIRSTDARQRVDLVLPPPATLRVRLASQTGERPRVSQFSVEGEFDSFALGHDSTGPWGLGQEEDGRLITVRTAPGRVKISAWIESGPMVEGEATLVSGEVEDVLLQVPGDGVVRGHIVDPQRRRLRHGSVRWDGERSASGHADEDGRFRLFGVGRARGTIHVHAFVGDMGMLDASRKDVDPDGEPVEVLLETGARVTLRVLGLARGAPLTTALVSKTRMSVSRGVPSPEGLLEVLPPPGEAMLLVLVDPGQAPVVIELPALREGEERDLGTVRFTPGIEVRGRVTDASGSAVPSAEVVVAERWGGATTQTDTAGRFRLPRMPPRPFLLRVRVGVFPQHLVTVDPLAQPAPEIVLTPGGVAVVRVVDVEGRGVAGARVTIFPAGEFPYEADFNRTRHSFVAEGEGTATGRLCTGPQRLRAYDEARELQSEDAVVTIREGETTEVTLVLRERPAK